MNALLAFRAVAEARGDGHHPELVALLERFVASQMSQPVADCSKTEQLISRPC